MGYFHARKTVLDNTTPTDSSHPSTPAQIEHLAREVVRGNWGNGSDRRRRLTDAGHDFSAIQRRVNRAWTGSGWDWNR